MSAARRRRGAGPIHGMVLIDKPLGPTSFKVARHVQRTLDAGKVGHGGTLDPLASGLLIVLLGEATKLTPWVQGRDKRYVATVAFGRSTDTLDRGGQTVEEAPVPAGLVTDKLEAVIARFVGDHMQRPPVYSALKVDGRSHMSRARAGEEVVVDPRPSRCHAIKLIKLDDTSATLEVHVGSGYYIRSLARDLGDALGVPSHLAALRRTTVGPWKVDDAVTLEHVTPDELVPLANALPDMPILTLSASQAQALGQGKRVTHGQAADEAMAIDPLGVPIAMVEAVDGEWRVKRGFYLPNTED